MIVKMKPFNCKQCRTFISTTPYGQLTECEHHLFQALPPWPKNKRTDFLRLLNEFVIEENVVTKSVFRQILKRRISHDDIS